MYVCLCKGLREAEFCALASCHGACPESMKQAMGLDESCCGRCEANLEAMIQGIAGCPAVPSAGKQS
jgi:bacterioferritin-associated ferredoxin